MTEAQLIERSQQGNQDAYEQLVRSYSELAFRVAYVVTQDAGEAEDATQEAFVKAWYALSTFDPARPFRPWLLRIVSNEARNRRASSGRRLRLVEKMESLHQPTRDDTSPEYVVLSNEGHERVLRAFNELREDDRLVLACRYFFDLSELETSETLAIARGTVKSRLSRALGRLRTQLESQWNESASKRTCVRDEEAD